MAKRQYKAAVSASVAKAFTDIGSTEILRVKYIAWNNKTANAGGTLTFENESGAEDFYRISLDIAGSSGQVWFEDDGYELTKGKDIKITLSGGTTDCWVNIDCESRTALQ